ncbi:MAG: tRNA (adenosine(37)-N6)-threonylcarbamoyltransferase complex transferase subunit TsaD [Spirochaetales bacterium]|jgi:N6-L-threonylcarbamoyladenine synthase|nr:tRNA (adenosine(37)-N6)-threonylcarbamoyltransferase complex transferase subunit TsaD [Spirochaetales bacterium]
MKVLGIETSCDECAAAVVEDGRRVLSNVIVSQVEVHKPYNGVVPELASRAHIELIQDVYERALKDAGLTLDEIDGVAAASRPGLLGALLVGLSFAKALAWSRGLPFAGVDHVRAHLHAPHIENDIAYPYLGLLVSGGHTLITRVGGFDEIEVLGTTIDDSCGEAFDKVAKFYGFGFPGGAAVDRLARGGDAEAFSFPDPSLHKGEHRYDVSYSGLKTAAVNQLDMFLNPGHEKTPPNIAASFQKAAIDILLRRLLRAAEDTGLSRIVVGGGVAANSYLRSALAGRKDLEVIFPSPVLCTDNGAMIAALGYELFQRGRTSAWTENASARVAGFRRGYP